MSNLPRDHQQLSPTSPSPTPSAQKPLEPWQAQEHEAPENQYLYGNGPYDGMEVAPTNDKEHATSIAYTSGSHEAMLTDNKRRRVCGMPIMAFYALIGFIAVAVILGAVLGGVLGSRVTKNREPEEKVMTTTPTDELAQSTSSALPEATESSYSGPLRSDEWHYIFWSKNGTNAAMTAVYDPFNISSGFERNDTFVHRLENLHNETVLEPKQSLNYTSNHTQHWQFLEVPSSVKTADLIRKTLNESAILYWIANRELGQGWRLTTDWSTSQNPQSLSAFQDLGRYQVAEVGIRAANDANPAQWWFIGDELNGESTPGETWWLANAYTRLLNADGTLENYYLHIDCYRDPDSTPYPAPRYIGREACVDGNMATPWNIEPIEKITEDGWRVS